MSSTSFEVAEYVIVIIVEFWVGHHQPCSSWHAPSLPVDGLPTFRSTSRHSCPEPLIPSVNPLRSITLSDVALRGGAAEHGGQAFRQSLVVMAADQNEGAAVLHEIARSEKRLEFKKEDTARIRIDQAEGRGVPIGDTEPRTGCVVQRLPIKIIKWRGRSPVMAVGVEAVSAIVANGVKLGRGSTFSSGDNNILQLFVWHAFGGYSVLSLWFRDDGLRQDH